MLVGGACPLTEHCIVFVHSYRASLSMSLSEAPPVRLSMREKTGFEVREG